MSSQRVLIADDEEGIRESLKLILGRHYELEFATDGEEALNALKNNEYGVTLLDIKMPKMDGLDVLKNAREQGVETPVIMLTAYQSVELAQQAVQYGAKDYLPKPFETDQVRTAVKRVLEGDA